MRGRGKERWEGGGEKGKRERERERGREREREGGRGEISEGEIKLTKSEQEIGKKRYPDRNKRTTSKSLLILTVLTSLSK